MSPACTAILRLRGLLPAVTRPVAPVVKPLPRIVRAKLVLDMRRHPVVVSAS